MAFNQFIYTLYMTRQSKYLNIIFISVCNLASQPLTL